jgi:hypothetical protein
VLLHDTQLPGTLALNQTLHPAPYTHPPQLPGTQALPRGQMVLTPDSWAREMEHPDRDFAFQVRGRAPVSDICCLARARFRVIARLECLLYCA